MDTQESLTDKKASRPTHDPYVGALTKKRAVAYIGSGRYLCHACGAKGGDVLDFHRARYGLGFRQAAENLGAWES